MADYLRFHILSNHIQEGILCKKCSYSRFFRSAFSRIRIEWGEIQSLSPYSVQVRENTNQINSERQSLFSFYTLNKKCSFPLSISSFFLCSDTWVCEPSKIRILQYFTYFLRLIKLTGICLVSMFSCVKW